MGTQSAVSESGAESGGNRWTHGVDLARVTVIDLAILAGHMLLYPTGFLPERAPGPRHPPDTPNPSYIPDTLSAPDVLKPGGADPASGPYPPRPRRLTEDGRAAARTDGRPDPNRPPDPPYLPPAAGHPLPPVVLLHGFVDNRSAFTLLRRSLLHHGWPRVTALNYSPLTWDIRSAAEQLGPHIEQICAESGHARVDIVGHSLGGLVARYYVQRLGGDAKVRTLVTLGTPHSGTRAIPTLAPHPLALQMRPGSAVLEELAGPAPGCRTRFVAFWSDLDQLMIPVEAARIEHADLSARNIRVHGIGHLALPVTGSVTAEIRRALSDPGPMPPAIHAA